MTLPLMVFSGEDVATILGVGSHPQYQLDWAGETDRLFVGANGPVAWALSRSDGEACDAPEEGSLTVTLQGSDADPAVISLDLEGDASGYTLAALVEFATGGSYRLRVSLSMPDGTIIITETPLYIL